MTDTKAEKEKKRELKVSITIPCFNQESTIKQAVESALMQDYPHIEVIVSDNHSTDKSMEIVKAIKDDRLRVIEHDHDRGRIANYRGMLYEYMTGELFLNVDGDDYLTDPQYISKAVKRFQEEEGIVMVFAKSMTLIEATGRVTRDKVNTGLPRTMDGNWLFLEYPKGIAFPYVTCLFRRDEAIRVGFYREDILSLDWESTLKLIVDRKVGYIDEYVAMYRRHATNSTKETGVDRMMENTAFVEEPYAYAKEQGHFSENDLTRWRIALLKRYFVKQIVRMRIIGRHDLARELMKRIAKGYPEVLRAIKSDPRYWIFSLVYRIKPLMRLVFKHYFKLEGFYHDLEHTAKGG